MSPKNPIYRPEKNGTAPCSPERLPRKDYMTNWIDCIRTNKTPNASVEICHRSAVACHMANLAYRQKTAHHPTEPEFDTARFRKLVDFIGLRRNSRSGKGLRERSLVSLVPTIL